MAVRQKEREAGGSGGTEGGEGRALIVLKKALRGVYEVARGLRQGQQEHEIKLPELGGLAVMVYTKQREPEEYAAVFEVFMRDHPVPLCKVEFSFRNGELYAFEVDCLRLGDLASKCARGKDCALSWEEMEDALKLAGLAVNVLAGLAGAPAKVEKVGLVEARYTRNGKLSVLPCLQVSVKGKSYSVCEWARLSRNPGEDWGVKDGLMLVPIGEAHAKMIGALAELKEMVEEHLRSRESEGAKRIHAREHLGKFLGLKEVVLRRPDGTEEVLLEPWLYKLNYIGEGLAVVYVYCPYSCSEGSDSELADAFKKELEEVVGKVVQACGRLTGEHDPRYAVFAYIALEALGRAGLA